MLHRLWLYLFAIKFCFQTAVTKISSKDSFEDTDLERLFPQGTFTNNYGYGPFGIGPTNSGFDSFGFWKTKYSNSGLSPLYTWQSYRNYYGEFAVHNNRYNNPAPADFENLQEERFGPYYNGIWGYVDHSPYWNG